MRQNPWEELNQTMRMLVWDNQGQAYGPVRNYDGEIIAYAPAKEAIELANQDLSIRLEQAEIHQ